MKTRYRHETRYLLACIAAAIVCIIVPLWWVVNH